MMKYMTIFKWLDDGFVDGFESDGLDELKRHISTMKKEGLHTIIEVSKVLPNGEHVTYDKIKY